MKVNISNNELLRWLDWVSLATPKSRVLIFSLAILVLAILPTNQLYLLPVRSVYETFGLHSFSTGIIRSVSYILHGEWVLAWQMNKLGYVVLVTAGVIYLKDVANLIQNRPR